MSILDMFTSGNFGKLEEDAKAVIANAEKIIADVLASNGNVVGAIVTLAADFKTIVAEVQAIRQIVTDLQALTQSAPVIIPAVAAAANAHVALPSATPVAPTPAPSFLAAVEKALDPFTPRPLAHAVVQSEPHGGA